MTHRRASAAIMQVLLSKDAPMTRAGIAAEAGIWESSITNSLDDLIARGLVEPAGHYTNPGSGRKAQLLAPGPLIRAWASGQRGDE